MYYIVPRERFDRKAGLNIAEFEFPAYFNFFVRRKRVNLVCPGDLSQPFNRNIPHRPTYHSPSIAMFRRT
jgi:hypothetical protein